jgi:HSP20 family protein
MQTTGSNGAVDVDAALNDVARIYRSITGQDLPRNVAMSSPIPPERDPQDAAREALGQLFALVTRMSPAMRQSPVLPMPVDCWEKDGGEIHLVADMPGIERESLRVRLERGMVTISARRNQAAPERSRPAVLERGAGTLFRTVALPMGFDAEHAQAELDGGVLRVRLVRGNKSPDRDVEVR